MARPLEGAWAGEAVVSDATLPEADPAVVVADAEEDSVGVTPACVLPALAVPVTPPRPPGLCRRR